MRRIVGGRIGVLVVAGLAGVVALSAPVAWAEKVEIVTGDPSPDGLPLLTRPQAVSILL